MDATGGVGVVTVVAVIVFTEVEAGAVKEIEGTLSCNRGASGLAASAVRSTVC
jgi:hypothetical protein